tara:strand:- start:58 stop:660 length:603 start_codon:yes stop_codon:yes gene_type:complete
MLKCKNINISLKTKKLISNFNISIYHNEIWTLMAPSGSGKSTLLKYILGNKESDFSYNGDLYLNEIHINSKSISDRDISMIFQNDLLFPHMTIIQNLNFVNKSNNLKAIDLLKENKLDHIANSMPDKISGGEKSRVLLIRVLLLETSVILLDEPFNGLDTETKFKTKDFFNKNLLKFNKIALMVTHNEDDVIDNKKILNL